MSLISVTPKLDAFAKFCSDKAPDTTINHSDGWDFCAIGEFKSSYNDTFVEEQTAFASSVAIAISDEITAVSDDLGYQFLDKIGNASGYSDIATYGGLSQWLNQFQHKVIEAAQ